MLAWVMLFEVKFTKYSKVLLYAKLWTRVIPCLSINWPKAFMYILALRLKFFMRILSQVASIEVHQ